MKEGDRMEKYYPALMHNLSRALGEIHYPITKEELLSQRGSRQVQIDFDRSIPLEDLIRPTPLDRYSCAAELYNNLVSVLW